MQGQTSAPILQNVFTLKSCSPIVGAQVISSETEAEMLSQWRNFLIEVLRTCFFSLER